ncbi:division plane positioning ATPase MipZ [Cereibacter sp. SYSU M97828]|nr:division plane positioning ATPase MipZ [Cereibacter flavus]
MTSIASLAPRPAFLAACTISRDLSRFDQLVTEMEAELGDQWADLSLATAAGFLSSSSSGLRFVVFALDAADEGNPAITEAMEAARSAGLRIMLVCDGIGPMALQQILRLRPDDVLAYPLPHGALREAALRGGAVDATGLGPADDLPPAARRPQRDGVAIPIIGVAGGVGATTLAIGLAYELGQRHRVCLIDLDPRSGSVAAYLNLNNTAPAAFPQGLQNWRNRFHVLVAADGNLSRLIASARAEFDLLLLDLPTGDAGLAAAAMAEADIALTVMEPDARSVRSALRLSRDLDPAARARLRHVVNRAPGVIDITGRARLRRFSNALTIAASLPDGGRAVAAAAERAIPLAEAAPRNGFRRSLQSLADSLPLRR